MVVIQDEISINSDRVHGGKIESEVNAYGNA